jgi:hypothetical protein
MNVELPDSVINGRFQYLDRPNVLPGHCAVCGSVERPVIDFGMSLDGYGAVLLCVECLQTAVSLVAMVEGASPVVSPHIIKPDAGTINEYITASLSAVNSLNVVLSYFGFDASPIQDAVVGESKDEGLPSTTESEPESIIEPSPDVPVNKRSSSVSSSRSDKPISFDL